MDIAAAICAGKHCEAHVVTVSVDYVSFQKPIHVGDVITLEATVTRAFNTSVEIYVQVFASDIKGHNSRRCNDAYFTFVSLDDETKKPTKVPDFLPLTNEEQRLFESASRRREIRLILANRLQPKDATDLKNLFLNS
jgi:acyl-CoA hydrolase